MYSAISGEHYPFPDNTLQLPQQLQPLCDSAPSPLLAAIPTLRTASQLSFIAFNEIIRKIAFYFLRFRNLYNSFFFRVNSARNSRIIAHHKQNKLK
jgi:hypothetical protein